MLIIHYFRVLDEEKCIKTRETCANAEHPDMVQEFVSKTQNSRSVMLEWKPPRKPGVFNYKVCFLVLN